MSRLKRILIVDDSETDNFIHRRRLRKLGLAQEIVVHVNGRTALDYLTAADAAGEFPGPDLLFLDINMPVLDGWGFLDSYQELPPAQRAAVTIVMLTSVVGEMDHQRAYGYSVVDGHTQKPLARENLAEIFDRFYPQAAE